MAYLLGSGSFGGSDSRALSVSLAQSNFVEEMGMAKKRGGLGL